MPKITIGYAQKLPFQKTDALLSQDNPVSNQLYTVLDTALNVEIISIAVNITWAITQPTNLRIYVTVDGKTIIFTVATPVSGTNYYLNITPESSDAGQATSTTVGSGTVLAIKYASGKSVKVETRVTWGVTQPTPLVCRVKYAQW